MAPTIDDELLALAGGLSDDGDDGSDGRQDTAAESSAPSRKTKSSSSSLAPRKKRRLQDGHDDDAEHDDEDDDDEQSGMTSYPVEGVYKSMQDKQNIENLPLIERESILAQRRDEILSRERTAQLAGMVAAQQGRSKGKRSPKKATSRSRRGAKKAKAADSDMDQSDDDEDDDEGDDDDEEEEEEDDESDEAATTTRSTRKVKSVGSSDTRNAKLQELSENRRKKAAGRSNRRSSPSGPHKTANRASSDSSDSESDQSEGYVESDDDTRNRRRKGALGSRSSRFHDGPFVAPDLEDINRARIGRDDILKIMYKKGWQDKLIGSFVRIVVDPIKDHHTGKMVPRYRAYEIIQWKKGSKYYAVDQGTFTQIHLVLAFGKEKHTREIKFVSNSNITQDEFQRYNAQAQQSSHRPSKQNVIDQADDFADFVNEPWTEDTLAQVIKAKKEARIAAEEQQHNPANPTTAATNGQSATNQHKSEDVLLAELNQRNRIADRQRIQDANKRQAEVRRAAAIRQAQAQAKAAAGGSDHSASTSAQAGQSTPQHTHNKHPAPVHKAATEVDFDLGDF